MSAVAGLGDRLRVLTARIPRTGRQYATLLTGTGIASLLNLLSFAIVARGLGPSHFGLLTLVRSYAAVVTSLAGFQTSLAVIKFGSDALVSNRIAQIGPLVKWGIVLDSLAGTIGLALGTALVWMLGPSVGVPSDANWSVTAYLLIVPLAVQGTPGAVLRLFERYRTAAVLHAAGSLFCVVAVATLSFSRPAEGNVDEYLGVFFAADGLTAAGTTWAAVRCLRERRVRILDGSSLRELRQQWPGVVRFVTLTNLQGTAKQLTSELDIFLVGSVLGTAAAGLYKVAKQLSSASSKILEPLYQVVYPLLARLVAERRHADVVRTITRWGAFAGGISFAAWIAFFLFTDEVLEITVGRDYIGSASVAVWYFAAVVVMHASFALSRTLLALGRPALWLWISLPCSVLYIASLPFWMRWKHLEGAGIAHFLYHLTFSTLTALAVVILLRNLRQDTPSNPGTRA